MRKLCVTVINYKELRSIKNNKLVIRKMDELLKRTLRTIKPIILLRGRCGSGKITTLKQFLSSNGYSYTEYNTPIDNIDYFIKSIENVGIDKFFSISKRCIIIRNYESLFTKLQLPIFTKFATNVSSSIIPVFLTSSSNKEVSAFKCIDMIPYTPEKVRTIINNFITEQKITINSDSLETIINSCSGDISHMKEAIKAVKNEDSTQCGISKLEFKTEDGTLNKFAIVCDRSLPLSKRLNYTNLYMGNIVYSNYPKGHDNGGVNEVCGVSSIAEDISFADTLYNFICINNTWDGDFMDEYYTMSLLSPLSKTKLSNLHLTNYPQFTKIKFNAYNDLSFIQKYITKDPNVTNKYLVTNYNLSPSSIKSITNKIGKKYKAQTITVNEEEEIEEEDEEFE
jgi:hypothetical protein